MQKNPKDRAGKPIKSARIIAITGPTAAGKTELALRLARRLDAEIVSCDSRAVYRGLPALTAVPNGGWEGDGPAGNFRTVPEGIPYHLVDFLDPRERWNASDYAKAARAALDGILRRKQFAIVAGGSGLYFRALREGLSPLPGADAGLRQEFEKLLQKEGLESLTRRLRQKDPQAACRVDLKNPRRVIRALELAQILGGKISGRLNRRIPLPWPCAAFYLAWPREEIKKRIQERADRSLDQMAGEVEKLHKEYGPQAPAWEALMAEPVHRFAVKEISREQAVLECARRDAAYAKKQETWFKKETDMIRIDMDCPDAIGRAEKIILSE